MVARLKTEGSLELIWKKIKAGVQTALWDEFKDAYGNKPNNEKFIDLINNWQYLEPPDLSEIERALEVSTGYQAYLGEQNAPSELAVLSLWTNRHSSSEAQEAFNKHDGLELKP